MSSDYTVDGNEPVYRKKYFVKEKKTGVYSFTIKKEDGTVVPASALTSATLSLFVPATAAIVNGRDAQSALNANNVTIDEAGLVTWTQQIADMAILDDALEEETHRALFLFTWQAGARQHPHEVDFVIENLGKLT